MKESSWLKSRRFWLGLAFSVTLLGLFFWQVPLGKTLEALREANYWWFVPALAVYFAAVLLRTYRWHFLLRPLRPIPTRRLFPVVVVGYMANNLLPIRLGEIVRSYYVAQREQVSGSAALATIIVERVFDGLVLIALALSVWAFLPTSHLLRDLAEGLRLPLGLLVALAVLPFVVAFLAFLALAAFPAREATVVGAITWFIPGRLKVTVRRLLKGFMTGLVSLRSPKGVVRMLLLSVPIWLCEATMYWLIGLGFGLDKLFHSFLLTTATSNLATSVPAPGGVGPFEFATQVTLVSLGAEAGRAGAYALALHAALLVPVTILGFIVLWKTNISFAGIMRSAKGPAVLSAHPGPVKP